MIAILFPLLLAQGVQQPSVPRRAVPDSGVIVNAARVTPAGVQSVFDGRVGGVRFGSSDDDIWVAVPGSVYHLAWRDNRVISTAAYSGRPGVQGVAIDPLTGRAAVSTVGRGATNSEGELPGGVTKIARNQAARLAFFDPSSTDASGAAFASRAVGDFTAGAPAVARVPNASGHRIAVLPLTANDRLAVIDADRGIVLRSIELGVGPIAAVVSSDGSVAWVTNFGGAKPGPRDRSATECCYERAERVRVDARGIAKPGSVMRVDLATGKVTHSLTVGRHPTAMAWDTTHARLYVADGNDESISVIDTRAVRVTRRIDVGARFGRRAGAEATALALSPDGGRLYAALGALNAVAVYDAAHGEMLGVIPTGWYPSSLDISADGRFLAVGSLFGVGSGTGETDGSPRKRGRYVFAERGSVNVVEIPSDAQLAAYTKAVQANDRLAGDLRSSFTVADSGGVVAQRAMAMAVPSRPGVDSSLVQKVVYIVKENRTYDQILGDLGRGDGDSSLVIYGRDVTPNQHALAEQFVTIDRMFASGGNSADGHQWLTQANETEYAMWPLYEGRSYPSEGNDPLTYSSGGFLWESAQARGKTVAVFGEYAPAASDSIPSVRASWQREFAANRARGSAYFRALMAERYHTHSQIPSLDRVLVREYPGWTQEVPDVVKAQVILAHLAEWEREGRMPDLVMIVLPSDHTVGMSPGWCTPRACVADNDAALGMLVDGFSHSTFWKNMAILVVEDDAQNGVDHVDGHRTTAFVASPYARRGAVDHTFYNQPSMVKTIERMLGLPALSLFDLVATDMRASFIDPGEVPDFTPFTALAPRLPLDETNPRVSEIRGRDAAARRRAAVASLRMRFDGPDEAPSDALNRILWHEARGWGVMYPTVRHSLFFPMSRDLSDSEREERTGAPANRRDR